MYQGTSELFNELIKAPSRTFKARLVGETEIIDKGFRTLKVNLLSNENKNTLSIGGITASELEVEIDGLSGVVTGKEFDVQIGLLTDFENKVYEWVSIGKFTAQKPTTRAYTTKFTAYDRFVSKLGGLYLSSLTYPATGKAILDEISALSGVPIKTDGITALNFPMRTTLGDNGETTQVNPFDGFTYRETIGYIAMAYGKFATVNRNGEVELRWYTDNGYRIEKNMSYDDIEVAQTEFSVDYLNVVVNNDRNNPIQKGEGVTGVTVGSPIFTEEMLNYAYGQISGFKYLPTTLSFKGDPRIDLGDIVTVVKSDSTEIKVPIMSLDFDFDGGLVCKVGSYGDTEQSNNTYASNPNSQRYNRLYTDILLLNQAIANKVTAEYVEARYVSTANLDAIQADITQAVIRDLETEFLTADEADIKYANIELSNIAVADVGRLFADVGLITDLVVVDGHITGVLDSVTINANNITSGTLTTDRLVIRGTDKSIVYELNNIDGALQAKEVDTLNGEIITPRTINADRIVANTITSSELNTDEIFANSAIIKKIFSEDVEATGTIIGATLKGAYAEITNGFIGGFDIKNNFLGFLESAPYQDLTTSEEKMSYWYSFMIRPESYNNTFAPTTKVFWLGAHPNIVGSNLDENGFYDESRLNYPLYFTADGGAYFSKGKIGRWEIVNSTSLVGTFDNYSDTTGILAQLKSESTGEITQSTRLHSGGILAQNYGGNIDSYIALGYAGILGSANIPNSAYARDTKFIDIIQVPQLNSSNNVVGIRTELDLSADIINLKAQPSQASGVTRIPSVINTDMEFRNGLDVYAYYNNDDKRVSLRGLADSKVSKSGDTMTGSLDISSPNFPALNLTREGTTTGGNYTAIQFNNDSGMLGGIAMNTVSGDLNAVNANGVGFPILDKRNYNQYALPLSGGTVTGASTFSKMLTTSEGSIVAAQANEANWGTAGYVVIAKIVVKKTYMSNSTLMLTLSSFSSRTRAEGKIYVRFTNSNIVASTAVSEILTYGTPAMYYVLTQDTNAKTATLELIAQKAAYESLAIKDMSTSSHFRYRVNMTFPMTFESTLRSGAVAATTYNPWTTVATASGSSVTSLSLNAGSAYILNYMVNNGMSYMFSVSPTSNNSFIVNNIGGGGAGVSISVSGTTITFTCSAATSSTVYTVKYIELK